VPRARPGAAAGAPRAPALRLQHSCLLTQTCRPQAAPQGCACPAWRGSWRTAGTCLVCFFTHCVSRMQTPGAAKHEPGAPASAQDTRSADGATTLLQHVAARVALTPALAPLGDELPALGNAALRTSLTVRGRSPHRRSGRNPSPDGPAGCDERAMLPGPHGLSLHACSVPAASSVGRTMACRVLHDGAACAHVRACTCVWCTNTLGVWVVAPIFVSVQGVVLAAYTFLVQHIRRPAYARTDVASFCLSVTHARQAAAAAKRRQRQAALGNCVRGGCITRRLPCTSAGRAAAPHVQ